MKMKLMSILFCMLFIIAAVVPVTAKVEFDLNDEEKNQNDSTRGWIILPDPLPVNMLLERSICRRMSFHSGYPSTPVTDEQLSTILWAAYGQTTTGGRTVYSPNGTYSTTIYVIRSEATYVYHAENHSLLLWKTGNYLNLGQATNAPIKLGLVWNMSIAADEKAGMAEIGMIAQNVYFDANALNLATITTGMSVNDLYDLDLPSNEKPEIIMHLGHPPTPYSFTYDPLPASNLPAVVNSTITLADAVTNRQVVNEWNNSELSLLEESQILWCSYGLSYLKDNINNKHHRTLPSAINIYPFKIYAANQTGVYRYTPTTHSISLVVAGDRRELIEDAVDAGDVVVSSSPWIIVPFWDKNVEDQYLQWWWYESGAIVHNIFLEAAALNLGANVLPVITNQEGLRTALGVSGQTNLVPFHVAMVGHVNQSSQNNPPQAPSISGPSNGQRGIQYNYTIATTDPENDDVYYYVDWADGTHDGWIGPFPSGMMVSFNHTWSQVGTYIIKVKAKDSEGLESIWSTYQMTITGPGGLSLDITGGLGIKMIISNTGTTNVTNIAWAIAYEGGFIILPQKTGMVTGLSAGDQVTIHPWVFGLGKPTIRVSLTADDDISLEKTVNIVIIIFFVIVK
jgi:nitroreductase